MLIMVTYTKIHVTFSVLAGLTFNKLQCSPFIMLLCLGFIGMDCAISELLGTIFQRNNRKMTIS